MQTTVIKPSLTEGGVAYVRIKEFDSEPMKVAKPQGMAQKFKFADTVKLAVKWGGQSRYPNYWLVSDGKDGPQSWIPEYLLTPSAAEIDMLRNKNRIPESMTFIYDQVGDGGKSETLQHGKVRLPGTPIVAMLTGGGVQVTDQGSSQVAFRGNAVVFDESVFKQPAWASGPIVFSDGTNKFEMAAGKIFYCTDGTGAGKFDHLDLPAK